MVIDNKKWLGDLQCWLHNAYRYKGAFKEFCVFVSDFKKHGISYNELQNALRSYEKLTENIFELSILTKNNICYKYRISKEVYDHFFSWFVYCFQSSTRVMLLKDFLEREDCAEYKEFALFVSEQYKTISCRTMNYEPEYVGDNISFFENVKKTKTLENFAE